MISVYCQGNLTQKLAAHNKKNVKAKWIILDVIKDYLIPHVLEKNTVKEIFDVVVSFFKVRNKQEDDIAEKTQIHKDG